MMACKSCGTQGRPAQFRPPCFGKLLTGTTNGRGNLIVVREQAPRQDVQIDAEDLTVTLDQGSGGNGSTPLDVADMDNGDAQCLGSGPLGHLPVVTHEAGCPGQWRHGKTSRRRKNPTLGLYTVILNG